MSNRLTTEMHARRRALGYSLRDVEDKTRALSERQPEIYGYLNRSTGSRIEERGDSLLLQQPAAVLRAMIVVLYGSVEQFNQELGVDLHLSPATPVPERSIPLWQEGDAAFGTHKLTDLEEGRDAVPAEDKASLFAMRVGSMKMSPKLFPGQIVRFCVRQPEAGNMVAVVRNGKLELAFLLHNGMLTNIHDEPFALRERSPATYIVGVATEPLMHLPPDQLLQAEVQATA